jgi:hypothetical protein
MLAIVFEGIKEDSPSMGAPRGNNNARKHGFYSRTMEHTSRRALVQADGLRGLDEEIALLRVRIRELSGSDPETVKLQFEAFKVLGRLIWVRNQMGTNRQDQLRDAVLGVVVRAQEMGINYVPQMPVEWYRELPKEVLSAECRRALERIQQSPTAPAPPPDLASGAHEK